jgi:hypothetical protein
MERDLMGRLLAIALEKNLYKYRPFIPINPNPAVF